MYEDRTLGNTDVDDSREERSILMYDSWEERAPVLHGPRGKYYCQLRYCKYCRY